MVTLRMFALAAALLLGTPLALAVLPVGGGDVLDAYAEVVATVEDVTLVEPLVPVTGRAGDVRGETLVEGHTTFVTLDVYVWRNATQGHVNITGFVECHHQADVNVSYWFGVVPVPNRVDKVEAGCRVGEHVFVMPDPFMPPNAYLSAPPSRTGEVFVYETPMGETTYAEEYVYTIVTPDAWGEPVVERRYAFSTPVHEPWIHTDGRPKSFLLPLPEARLLEMGLDHYQVVLEDEVPRG